MIKNVKNKELATFLGVTPGFASHIRNGVRKLPPKDCVKVSKKFDIPLDVLRPDIFGTEQPESNCTE